MTTVRQTSEGGSCRHAPCMQYDSMSSLPHPQAFFMHEVSRPFVFCGLAVCAGSAGFHFLSPSGSMLDKDTRLVMCRFIANLAGSLRLVSVPKLHGFDSHRFHSEVSESTQEVRWPKNHVVTACQQFIRSNFLAVALRQADWSGRALRTESIETVIRKTPFRKGWASWFQQE